MSFMLRAYLVILVLVGLLAALAGRLPGIGSTDASRVIVIGSRDAASIATQSRDANKSSMNEFDKSIELTRDSNGYFYADVEINDTPVHMLIDTGATIIALSRDDARMAGIATSIGMNDVVGQGADGAVKGEEIVLDKVTLGNRTAEKLPAIILSNGSQSLLGQSFLSKFASVKIEGDKMVLQ